MLSPVFMHNFCSATEIAGFLNQLFLQNKSMRQPNFFNVDANSQKLKVVQIFVVGHDQKWVFIDCISRMN